MRRNPTMWHGVYIVAWDQYLGFPLHHSKLRKEDLQPVVDKILKRAPGWRGRLVGYDSKLIPVQSCLASIPSYLMGMIKFPKWDV